MDTSITPGQSTRELTWTIAENGGPEVGALVRRGGGFLIAPKPGTGLDGLFCGPFHRIEKAVAEIERHTGGRCHIGASG